MQLHSKITYGNSPMATMIRKYSYLKVVPEQQMDSARDMSRGFSSANSYVSVRDGINRSFIHASPISELKNGRTTSSNVMINMDYRSSGGQIRDSQGQTTSRKADIVDSPESQRLIATERISIRSVEDDSAVNKPPVAAQSGGSGSSRNYGMSFSVQPQQAKPQETEKKVVPFLSNLPAQPGSGSSDQHYEKILKQIVSLAMEENKGAAMTYLKSLITSADSCRSHNLAAGENQEELARVNEELIRVREELAESKLDHAKAKDNIDRLTSELDVYKGENVTFESARAQLDHNMEGLHQRIAGLVGTLETKSSEYQEELASIKENHDNQLSELQRALNQLEQQHTELLEKGDPEKVMLDTRLKDTESQVRELASKNEYLQSQ